MGVTTRRGAARVYTRQTEDGLNDGGMNSMSRAMSVYTLFNEAKMEYDSIAKAEDEDAQLDELHHKYAEVRFPVLCFQTHLAKALALHERARVCVCVCGGGGGRRRHTLFFFFSRLGCC